MIHTICVGKSSEYLYYRLDDFLNLLIEWGFEIKFYNVMPEIRTNVHNSSIDCNTVYHIMIEREAGATEEEKEKISYFSKHGNLFSYTPGCIENEKDEL